MNLDLINRVIEVRKNEELNQSQFAERLGLKRTIISLCENGKRDFSESQIEVLKQLADYVTQKGCFTRQELFTENRPLCMEAIKIYTPQKIDEEIDYFSKFLLQLKAA